MEKYNKVEEEDGGEEEGERLLKEIPEPEEIRAKEEPVEEEPEAEEKEDVDVDKKGGEVIEEEELEES